MHFFVGRLSQCPYPCAGFEGRFSTEISPRCCIFGLVQEFPAALQSIARSVRVLDATNNRITSERLPGYLAEFAALQRLVLTKNALTRLPVEVGALQNLKVQGAHVVGDSCSGVHSRPIVWSS